MTIEEHVRRRPIAGVSRPVLGAALVGLSGVGPVGYGLMFLIRNFAGSSSRGLPRGTWGGLDPCVGRAYPKGRWAKLLLPLILALLVALGFTSPAHAADAGDLDRSFGGDGKVTFDVFGDVNDFGNAVAMQDDGKIVVAGSWCGFGAGCNTRSFALARFNRGGSLDTSFGANGRSLVSFPNGPAAATGVAIQPDGKIVVAGSRNDDDDVYDGDFALARLEPDGDLDTTFSGDGKVITTFGAREEANAVAIQTNAFPGDHRTRIVVGGNTYTGGGSYTSGDSDFALARYNSNGSLDTSFDGDGKVTTGFGGNIGEAAEAVAIQRDGKIVAAGDTNAGNDLDIALARYNSSGSLDASFHGDGKVVTELAGHQVVWAATLQPDGKIVVAGDTDGVVANDFLLARYNADGTPDASFDGGALATDFGGNERAFAVAIQANGKIVAAGLRGVESDSDFALARLESDGDLDPTFSGDGKQTTTFGAFDKAWALAIQADGKIIAAGTSNAGGDSDFALARYHAVADNTPPETIIDSGPSDPTNNPRPTFRFYSNERGASFQCRFAHWPSGQWSICSSPYTAGPLSDRRYRFVVRAVDDAGNTDPTPAGRSFTVDTESPDTIIDSGPSGTTDDTTPTFAFHSTEADSRFRCSLDGSPFGPCASPKSYANLKNGRHVFRVRAIDAASNADPTPAVRAWTVDTIKSAISSLSPKPNSATRDRTPAIKATVKDNLTNLSKWHIKLYLDGEQVPKRKFSYNRSTDRLSYTSGKLSLGKHTVKVVAHDAAGNVAVRKWSFKMVK